MKRKEVIAKLEAEIAECNALINAGIATTALAGSINGIRYAIALLEGTVND